MTHVTEWKEMVANLIRISYKISDIVSPVVQSSSPEGLIPMDTNFGNTQIFLEILNFYVITFKNFFITLNLGLFCFYKAM